MASLSVFCLLGLHCQGMCNVHALRKASVIHNMPTLLVFVSDVWCPVEVNHGGSTRWAQIGTTEALKACPALCVSTNPPVCYTSSNKWQPLISLISCLLSVPDRIVIFRGQWLFSEICRTGSSVSLVLTHYHITSRLNHQLQWMQHVFVLVCIILNNNKFLSWSFLNFFQHS